MKRERKIDCGCWSDRNHNVYEMLGMTTKKWLIMVIRYSIRNSNFYVKVMKKQFWLKLKFLILLTFYLKMISCSPTFFFFFYLKGQPVILILPFFFSWQKWASIEQWKHKNLFVFCFCFIRGQGVFIWKSHFDFSHKWSQSVRKQIQPLLSVIV